MRKNAALVVHDHLRGTEEMLGGPGVQMLSLPAWRGDNRFFLGTKDTRTRIDVDLPLVLPLKEATYQAVLAPGPISFTHTLRRRGDQRFSSLDTTNLPAFSRLNIHLNGFEDGFTFGANDADTIPFHEVYAGGTLAGLSKLPTNRGLPLARSYLVICELLDKLYRFVELPSTTKPRMSYVSTVFTPDNQARGEATSHYPGEILAVNDVEPRFDPVQWEHFTAAAADLVSRPAPTPSSPDFVERVFTIVHDFCFYCRQHPEAINALEEELVRDLLLIVFKVAATAEGEAFHHRGKLDFKVTNPANKYEFVTGELKWWGRDDSAREAFGQLTREHATGQETGLVCLILSRNLDASSVDEKVRTLIAAEPEFRGPWTNCSPPGSRETAYRAHASIRGSSAVPLFYLLANVYV